MSDASFKLPEEKLLEFSKSIEVVATKILEGYHHSARGGRGVEFQSALPFSPGEDARFIDWKRYASTERLYVNRYQREERAGWRVWIDPSESMLYENKARWARLWAGCLLYLARSWGDSWWLAPDFSHSLEEAFRFLSAEGESHHATLADLERGSSVTDRLILISDFFLDSNELQNQVRRFQELYESVHLIQILSTKERDFLFSNVTEFVDLESNSKLILDAATIRRAYLKTFESLERDLKALVSDRVSFMLCMSNGASLENQLTEFFEEL